MLEDLIHFQVFVLSTMDNKEALKTHVAKYNWKEFLVNGSNNINDLIFEEREYSWKNKVTLTDKAEWCYKAIWVGRNQGNYKCHPEFLDEKVTAKIYSNC